MMQHTKKPREWKRLFKKDYTKKRPKQRQRLNLKLRKPNRVALEAPRRHSEVSQTEALAGPKATSLGVSNAEPKRSEIDETNNSNSAGKMLRTAENALNLERESLQKLKELDERNQSLRFSSNEDFGSTERHIARLIRQIRGTTNNVSKKAEELIKIFNNPHCPLTISIAFFAKKVVSNFDSADNAAFAYGYVIILVTSKFPQAMDLFVAELHRACIYTVPKLISYSKSAFESKEAYWKAIGY